MKLSEEIKQQIIDILDSKEFMSDLYEGLDEQKRIELGQFYTPGKICIQMIEKFSWDTLSGKTILDPTVGSGNLLIACLIAGADSDKVYGNDYDSTMVEVCRKRLQKINFRVQNWQVHQGNALIGDCITKFGPEYETTILKELLKKRSESNKKGAPKFTWLDRPELYVSPEPKSNKPKKSISDVF
jgi:hypothetical protein